MPCVPTSACARLISGSARHEPARRQRPARRLRCGGRDRERRRPARRAGRDRGPDRSQRRRQVDVAEADRGAAAAERRPGDIQGQRRRGPRGARDQPARAVVRAAGAQRLWRHDGRRESRDGRFHRPDPRPSAHGRTLPALSHAGREAARRGADLERRPAADPRHGDRADERPAAPAARRADGGSQPARRRRAVRHYRRLEPVRSRHPDGRAECARGARGLGARLCAGSGPAATRGAGGGIGRRSDRARSLSWRQGRAYARGSKRWGTSMTKFHLHRRTAIASGMAALAAPAIVRAQGEPIKIATLTPLTGAGGPYGPTMAKVAGAVVAEVNAAGGVLGRKVVLVSEDDQTNPDAGVRAARKLIDVDTLSAIIGTWASAVTTAVAPLCWESKTFLCTVSGADSITQLPHQGYLIRTQPNTVLQVTRA